MAKTKISEYDSTANNNTDVASVNIDEGCAPSGINNAIRAVMAHLKDFQQGTNGDSFNGPVNGTIGATTPAAGVFTTLSTSGNTTLGDDSGDVITINGSTAFGAGAGITGNLTLSSGTANGVAYLNGSKVLTTGSALQFDGTNLGLGVTPSAWGSGRRALQVAGSTANYFMGANANATVFGTNFFYDDAIGNNKYVATGAASMLLQSGGAFQFFTAPSGTAGNAISFTQAMTLDASGNLGIGTTSPTLNTNGTVLHINNSTASRAAIIHMTNAESGSTGTDGLICGKWSDGTNYFFDYDSNSIVFGTGGTERARIDSSGNLLVGTTGTLANEMVAINFDGSSRNGMTLRNGAAAGTPAMIIFQWGGSVVGTISANASGVGYNTSSDYRLKHDVAPMQNALAKIAALKPCTYKWNADGSDGEGFIAHELAEVVPQCVTGEKDAVDAEGNPVYQGIDTSFLAGLYAAALQELMAEVNSLKAEIAALKA